MRNLATNVVLLLLMPCLVLYSWLWWRDAERCGLIQPIEGRKSRKLFLAWTAYRRLWHRALPEICRGCNGFCPPGEEC